MCLTARHYVPDSQELFTDNDSVTDLVDDSDYIDVSETVNTIRDSSLACLHSVECTWPSWEATRNI